MAVEAVTDASVLRLKRPNAARWNSVYLAMEQGPWRKRVQEALRQAIRCQINQYRSGILGRVHMHHETSHAGTEHPPVRDEDVYGISFADHMHTPRKTSRPGSHIGHLQAFDHCNVGGNRAPVRGDFCG